MSGLGFRLKVVGFELKAENVFAKVQSLAKEGSAKPPKAGGGAAGGGEAPAARLSTGSSEFLKLFSPMADQMAEAAAQPRPASTTGDAGCNASAYPKP